jgi:hypothetical protein
VGDLLDELEREGLAARNTRVPQPATYGVISGSTDDT